MQVSVERYIHTYLRIYYSITLDFSSLLKNHFECSSVSWESSFQSSEISSEVRSVVRLEIGAL